MSDAVTVALIGGVVTLLAALLAHQSRSRQAKADSQPTTARNDQPERLTSEPNQGKPQPEKPRRVTDLTHRQMSDTIEAVPPLQRDGIAASFVGAWVSWRGTLFAASRRGDNASVALDDICELGGLVHCTAPSSECDALLIAPEGTELIVKGRVTDIHQHEAHLENCAFEIVPTSSRVAQAATMNISQAEQQRRKQIVSQLRRHYCLSNDGVPTGIKSGIAPLPKAWVEQHLKARGETWTQDAYY
jgi:hypothetical protein